MITSIYPELKIDRKKITVGNVYKFFGKFVLLKDMKLKNKNWILTFVNKDKLENILFLQRTYVYNDSFEVIIPMNHIYQQSVNYEYQKYIMTSLSLAEELESLATNTIKHWMMHNKYRPGSKYVQKLNENYYENASKQYMTKQQLTQKTKKAGKKTGKKRKPKNKTIKI